MTEGQSFLARHEFIIRRLHSLTGLIPVGAYMVVHLLTNAAVLEGAAAYQSSVYTIHSLGMLLPVVEWTFIFIPLIFHSVIGVWIVFGGLPNTTRYPYGANIRYTLQRWSGMVAFVFIFWHVFHMHGWIHTDWWLGAIRSEGEVNPLGGGNFYPYNAASTAGMAMQDGLVVAAYAIGILASVYHLANGIWAMGITWGTWISPAAQRRALWVCTGFGVVLLIVGWAALYGMWRVGRGERLEAAQEVEQQIYRSRVESGELQPNEEKVFAPKEESAEE